MALKLNKRIKQFELAEFAEIDCGDGFFVTIAQMSPSNRHFRAAIEKFSNKNRKKKISPNIVSATGKFEDDVQFFVDYVLVDWSGLVDDDGNEVEFSRENAIELFNMGEGGKTLFYKLLSAATNEEVFVLTEEERKN